MSVCVREISNKGKMCLMGICIHEPTIAREMEYIATGKVINVCLNI